MNAAKILNWYEEVVTLKGHDHVSIVMGKKDKKIYVRKCLNIYNLSVYDILSQIENIHIPKIIEYEEVDGKLYVVEEYIPGETLAEKVEQGYWFSEEETREIVFQLCEALDCLQLQSLPIVHRDIKLSNVMITNDGIVKLIDFNAARLYETGANKDTVMIGTAGYAAPEQYGFQQTDIRTDIYSMGVMMNYMLAGCSPVENMYSGRMGKIIQKCTYLDPDRRFQNIHELKKAIKKKTFQEAEKDETEHSFLPIPGFRTGCWWKKICATAGYLFIILIASGVETESNRDIPVIMMLDKICAGLWLLSLVALSCNYMGIRRYLPFADSSSRGVRVIGIFISAFLLLMIAALFPEVVKVLF